MATEVIGIDHIYIAVRDLRKSEAFYDAVMGVLGFRKNELAIGGAPHIQYYNRHFGYVLRPAAPGSPPFDAYRTGLHHFCFRVEDDTAVAAVARDLRQAGIACTEPQLYPQYAPDYAAVFFDDPDGTRLEVTNFREQRRKRYFDWENA